jgi:uncharacterized peroxidase-related enzyme
MAFVHTVPVDRAGGDVHAMYARIEAAVGYVPNYARLFSLRPQVMATWAAFLASIRGNMDPRRYELVTLAAARRLRSSYCMLAHGGLLASKFYDTDRVREIALDHHAAGLDEIDVAVMDLADKVAADAPLVTQADVDRLRELGLSDAEVFDVVAAAAIRCFFTKVVDALGFQSDPAYEELDEGLREALVVGRPIEEPR